MTIILLAIILLIYFIILSYIPNKWLPVLAITTVAMVLLFAIFNIANRDAGSVKLLPSPILQQYQDCLNIIDYKHQCVIASIPSSTTTVSQP
jgi:hypothetical protein